MPPVHPHTKTLLLTMAILSNLVSGCDDRATEIAREAANRQAEQNQVMAELQEQVADGSRQLVEADARARHEMIGVHHDLQNERSRLDSGWHDLNTEQRQIAGQRRTESLLVPLCQSAAVVLLAALVLGFSWYALASAHRGEASPEELNELLLRELVSDGPHLLSDDRRSPPPELPRLDRPPNERPDP